jgi:hypothetical protein
MQSRLWQRHASPQALHPAQVIVRGKDGTNYARDAGVTATAESTRTSTYAASKAIDGLNTTYFQSAWGISIYRGTVAWLVVDLGKDIPMASIESVSAGNSYGEAPYSGMQACFILRWLDASGAQLQMNRNIGSQSVYYYYPGEPGFETQPCLQGWSWHLILTDPCWVPLVPPGCRPVVDALMCPTCRPRLLLAAANPYMACCQDCLIPELQALLPAPQPVPWHVQPGHPSPLPAADIGRPAPARLQRPFRRWDQCAS